MRVNHSFAWTIHRIAVGTTVVHFSISSKIIKTTRIDVKTRRTGK